MDSTGLNLRSKDFINGIRLAPITSASEVSKAVHYWASSDPRWDPVHVHIARRARALNCTESVPLEWMEKMKAQDEPDNATNWWDEALDKQVSLKSRDDCKTCRLLLKAKNPDRNIFAPWMGTLCQECGKPRMAHRPQHPHMIDMGNRSTYDKTMTVQFEDCNGFEEPNLRDVFASLTRIMDATQ